MRKLTSALAVVLLAAALLSTGCMTAQDWRDKRIADNPSLFMQLDPGAQYRAQTGQVVPGDTQTAVWFAFGSPDKKTSSATASGVVETWDYYRSVPESYYVLMPDPPPPPPPPPPGPRMPPPPPHHHRPHYRPLYMTPAGYAPATPGWHYEERTRYVSVLARQVQFVNGICSLINHY